MAQSKEIVPPSGTDEMLSPREREPPGEDLFSAVAHPRQPA